MFDEFRDEIRNAYLDLKNRVALPSELECPSPGDLRDFCLLLWAKGLSKEDTQVFMKFFNPINQYSDLETSIRRFELDKLKPLQYFIIGKTAKPDENIVKLLAILIDFQPRPYEVWRGMGGKVNTAEREDIEDGAEMGSKNNVDDHESNGDSNTAEQDGSTVDGPPNDVKPPRFLTLQPNHNRSLLYLIIPIVIGVIIFFVMDTHATKQCMYWNDDRYTAVNCDEKITGIEVIARDNHFLKHFRKITQPDTLTVQHANKVWYSKINNTVEFFTLPGFHPVYRDRALKAATIHIIETYAQEKNDETER